MAVIPILQERILRSFAHGTPPGLDSISGLWILPQPFASPISVFSRPEKSLSMPRGAHSLPPGRQGCKGTGVETQGQGDGVHTLAPGEERGGLLQAGETEGRSLMEGFLSGQSGVRGTWQEVRWQRGTEADLGPGAVGRGDTA